MIRNSRSSMRRLSVVLAAVLATANFSYVAPTVAHADESPTTPPASVSQPESSEREEQPPATSTAPESATEPAPAPDPTPGELPKASDEPSPAPLPPAPEGSGTEDVQPPHEDAAQPSNDLSVGLDHRRGPEVLAGSLMTLDGTINTYELQNSTDASFRIQFPEGTTHFSVGCADVYDQTLCPTNVVVSKDSQSPTISGRFLSLPTDRELRFEISVVLPQADQADFSFNLMPEGDVPDSHLANNTAILRIPLTREPESPLKVSAQLDEGKDQLVPGDTVSYTVTYENTGDKAKSLWFYSGIEAFSPTGFQRELHLPVTGTITCDSSASSTKCPFTTKNSYGSITLTFPDMWEKYYLPAGKKLVIKHAYTLDSSACAFDAGDVKFFTPVLGQIDSVLTVPACTHPRLSVTTKANKAALTPGETVEFTTTYENTGSTDAKFVLDAKLGQKDNNHEPSLLGHYSYTCDSSSTATCPPLAKEGFSTLMPDRVFALKGKNLASDQVVEIPAGKKLVTKTVYALSPHACLTSGSSDDNFAHGSAALDWETTAKSVVKGLTFADDTSTEKTASTEVSVSGLAYCGESRLSVNISTDKPQLKAGDKATYTVSYENTGTNVAPIFLAENVGFVPQKSGDHPQSLELLGDSRAVPGLKYAVTCDQASSSVACPVITKTYAETDEYGSSIGVRVPFVLLEPKQKLVTHTTLDFAKDVCSAHPQGLTMRAGATALSFTGMDFDHNSTVLGSDTQEVHFTCGDSAVDSGSDPVLPPVVTDPDKNNSGNTGDSGNNSGNTNTGNTTTGSAQTVPGTAGAGHSGVNTTTKTPLQVAPSIENVGIGGQIIFHADGFIPGSDVSFSVFSTEIYLGTVKADPKGHAHIAWTVPTHFEPGKHRVVASNQHGQKSESHFTVATVPTDTPAQSHTSTTHTTATPAKSKTTLAHTGANTTGVLTLIAGAVLAGTFLTKRRHHG